jgi:Flp pilus assembly pilin Flp
MWCDLGFRILISCERRHDSDEQLLEEIMKHIFDCLKAFLVSEAGPTTEEYAVIVALVVLVCLAAFNSL